MAIKGAGKKVVEGPRPPYFNMVERDGKLELCCMVESCTFKTMEPHTLENHLKFVHSLVVDVKAIVELVRQGEGVIATPNMRHMGSDDPEFLKLQMEFNQRQLEASQKQTEKLAEFVIMLKNTENRSAGIRFDAILGEDGRLTIPEPTRILHKLKKGYVLTLSIEGIMERKKEDAS
jgi:hypothetical protein